MTSKVDVKDLKILKLLTTNARLSNNKIGKLVHLSANSVKYRIERLQRLKIISKFFTIINLKMIGYSAYFVFLKINYIKGSQEEKEIEDYIKAEPNITEAGKFLGRWNLLISFESKNIETFKEEFKNFKHKFNHIIDTYEVHSPQENLKIEQLPVNLNYKFPIPKLPAFKKAKIDSKDIGLLKQLSLESNAPLYKLAKNINLTDETVAARMKKLSAGRVIMKYTAKINLKPLGYRVYLIKLSLRNISDEIYKLFKSYLLAQHNIRYSFLSAMKPEAFIYLAVKNSNELEDFLDTTKEKFNDNIIDQNYMLSKGQIKYNLLPIT